MIPEVAQYLSSFKTLHDQLTKTLEGLTPEALDWSPTPGANSLGALVAHATGAERLLIAQAVGGVEIHRDRDAEFGVHGLDVQALVALIDAAAQDTEAILTPMTDEEIAKDRLLRGNPVTTRWCVVHALEHLAEHLGHAGLTRQLWDARK